MLPKKYEPVIEECKRALQALYRERFAGLVLYGSMARGDYDDESDIDLLVLLTGSVRSTSEIEAIDTALSGIQFECDRLISAEAVSLDDYQAGRWSFLRIAANEGASV